MKHAARSLAVTMLGLNFFVAPALHAESTQAVNLESVLNTIPDIIFYKDLDGVYRGGNAAWAKLAGKPLSELIGKSDFDLFPKELAESFRAYDQTMLSSGQTQRNDEWVIYPDGHRALIDTLKTPWLDADGNVIGVLGICRDITGKSADPSAEKALMEANQQFYDALAAMFTGDMGPMQAVWSHRDEVSLQGPFGGRLDGWQAVEAHFTKESQMGMAGRVLSVDARACIGTDMAYVICTELGDEMTIGGKPVVVNHRATNVFRLEDGQWKMVHHHTDLAPTLQNGK